MVLKRSHTVEGTLGPISQTFGTSHSALLNGMVQGAASESEYSFRKIKITNLDLRYWVQHPTHAASSQEGYRGCVAVVYDRAPKDGTAVLPTWTEVFHSLDPMSFQKVENSGRFQILYRSYFGLTSSGATASTSVPYHGEPVGTWFDTVYKKPNLEVRYDKTTVNTADGIGKGSIFIISYALVDDASGFTGGAEPSIKFYSRIKFQDVNK